MSQKGIKVSMRKSDVVRKLKKLRAGGETVVKRTVSDFASRGPGWVSQGIRKHYEVDKGAIADAQRTKRGGVSYKVKGIEVDGATLIYKGRTLTPIHFKMSEAKINPEGLGNKALRIPGQRVNFNGAAGGPVGTVRAPKPYKITATIIKGQKTTFQAGTFFASSSKKNADAPILPFQRTGEGRSPVHAVRTLSVAQMVDNPDHDARARETIDALINEKLQKRFENHMKQVMK